jgi:hypothetical protein
MKTVLILIFGLFLLNGCINSSDNETELVDEEQLDGIQEPQNVEEALLMQNQKDTSTTGSEEFKEIKKKIEKEYGTQWDFCNCVYLNDSLDHFVKNGGDIDDKFMDRFDEVEKHCKSFLVMDGNRTPDERAAHDRKIQKCLKSYKARKK